MDLEKIREGIPALSRYIHLNAAGISPAPAVVTDEVIRLYRLIGDHGYIVRSVAGEIEEAQEKTRRNLASYLNVSPEEIAFIRSVSEGVSIVAYGLPLKAGDEVIITDLENPACYLPWLNLARQKGIVVKKIRLGQGDVLSQARRLITNRTKIVAISHVTSLPGIRLPVEGIIKLAHGRGVWVLLDGAQAAGCLALDLKAMDCDFYTSTAYKWMMGPRGTGFLYLKRNLLPVVDVTWSGSMATRRLDYDTDEYEYYDSAKRYEYGSRHSPLYAAYGKAIQFFSEVGPKKIEERSLTLARRFKESLGKIHGVRVITSMSEEDSAGIVVFSIDGLSGDEAAKTMFSRHKIVCVGAEGDRVRFSSAFYLTDEEVEKSLGAVSGLARRR
jgi:selenocysteine lyase/cysteine desulfurase